ncbi:MAG: class I SAM-dependent methyltransferase [bacterium]|nr:class I SAM-dependent methyltransferase [bacterium]
MKVNVRKLVTFLFLTAMVAGTYPAPGQSDREQWQPPEKIMDAVGVRPGMTIGEPGAGSGYLTFPLAGRVGATGKVYANDISTSSLDEIRDRVKREGVENIEIVLGETEDPVFPERNLDMVIMVYVLHCLERPLKFMENVKKYLAPDAPLVIIERDTDHERAHPPSFMTKREVLDTIQETGYELERTETFLPRDTIYIFKLKERSTAVGAP